MEGTPTPLTFRIRPRRVAQVLASVALLLALGHVFAHLLYWRLGIDWGWGLIPKLSLDVEQAFATLFSGLLFVLCAVLLWLNGSVARRRFTGPTWPWTALAVLFALLALDEMASLHELTIEPVRSGLGVGGLLHYAWVVPAGLLLAVGGVVFGRFLFRLPSRTRGLFFTAATLFLGGALGVELLEGRHVAEQGIGNEAYGWYVLVEETLEMAGLVVFAYALLDALGRPAFELTLRASPGSDGGPTPPDDEGHPDEEGAA